MSSADFRPVCVYKNKQMAIKLACINTRLLSDQNKAASLFRDLFSFGGKWLRSRRHSLFTTSMFDYCLATAYLFSMWGHAWQRCFLDD